MKQIILILISYIICVKMEPNWTPIGSPLITAYPCGQSGLSRDIVTWFDPSLPPREKNRYYVYIHRVLPKNSKVRLVFDSDVIFTMNIRTENKKFVRMQFNKGEHFLLRLFKEMMGFGFIVKGVIPGKIPYFKSISINGKRLCNRPYSDYLEGYISETSYSGPQENCGVSIVRNRNRSANGTNPGDWPWHTALYRFDGTESKYICGGTLISKNFVLTAAHCASMQGVPLLPEVVTVLLGKYNLKRDDIGSQHKEISRIILHELYQYTYLYSDIALLKLKSEAIFNNYVQPACVWYSKAAEKLSGNHIVGTVVGWGLNGTTSLKNRLKRVEMSLVSETSCVLSLPITFSDIIVDSTKFCAGYHNGESACNGDSGSAFQIFVDGAWYVRGIVSLIVSKQDQPICDPEQYVVFTDVESYKVWIDAYLDNEDY